MNAKLEADFREIRDMSTPWCVVRTTDWLATMKDLLAIQVKGEESQHVAVLWTCVEGAVSPIIGPDGTPLSKKNDEPLGIEETALSNVLKNAKTMLEAGGMLFLVFTDDTPFENPFTVQAISDLREVFKTTRRTLIILGINPKLPAFLSEDIPILDDPLPDALELERCFMTVTEAQDPPLTYKKGEHLKAANSCLGMTRFAAEEAFARKMRKSGVDHKGLQEAQKVVIEQSTDGALQLLKEKWTYADIGGQETFKVFMESLFAGPKPPSCVLFWDEIDKCITSASTGSVADNTGVSQDILRTWLTAMEENKWPALMAVGGPGVGKSLSAICTGNTFGIRAWAYDSGATKGSLVGQSERKNRRVIEILKATGGENVLIIATANRLDTLPPELQRRFWLGTWFWDLPSPVEREAIWKIQMKRFDLKSQIMPNDDYWTGSDIRNACQMAWITNSPLVQAAERITISGIASRSQIESLRDLAERSSFRSAAKPGPYVRPTKEVPKRKVAMK